MDVIAWDRKHDVALGKRLTAARDAKGWSLQALADRMDVSKATVGHWEKSNRTIKHADLARLAGHLSVSADELLFGIKRWPFTKIDFTSVADLERDDVIRLEGALIFTAGQLGIEIKQVAA